MQPRSVRLNQDLRAEFIRTVIDEVMPDDKKPSHESFARSNAQAAYDATYGEIKDIIDQLPAWAVKEGSTFYIELGEHGTQPFISNTPVRTFYKDNDDNFRYYMNHNNDSPLPVLDDDHPLTQAFRANDQAIVDWETKARELRKQLHDLTDSCNTTGQLFKTWPKAIEFAYVFPQPEIKQRAQWEPQMDASELDLGVELAQVDVAPIEEN